MKYVFSILLIVVFSTVFFVFGYNFNKYFTKPTLNPSVIEKIIEKPLEKYQIENLSKTDIEPGTITIKDIVKENDYFTKYNFSFEFDPALTAESKKTTTGTINIPKGDSNKYPLIIMIRGWVNQEIYTSGMGTSKASEYFAENGFLTIAVDYLGYADSDREAENIFESRFQTYTTTLSLIESLSQLKYWDGDNIFLWGHSNGGQISIIVLESTSKIIPTTLWAPVTIDFPYSILYYTDQSDDKGKLIRSELAIFENLYDVEKYSLTNYLSNIDSPIILHQGGADDAVPKQWNEKFVNNLENIDKDVNYYYYPLSDHNLRQNWQTVVERDLKFFTNHLD